MSDYRNTAQRYIDTWNETDPAKRRLLVTELFTVDTTYTDPLAQRAGTDDVDQMIAGVQEQFAGLVFTLGEVDGHHDLARFTWYLGAPGADEPLVEGFDVLVLADNKIKHVHGFLNKVPA
ncbi:nuclear transport factor 2 family protein [Actinocrispum wychmicini]|uniref:SnoaL-like protein n=1 Tax=Actinocrispum wychmicini TaxID=1213861 RepID=A0A4R2JT83_9PSEU|nr:nuclear transport factor 2 family protein [Actinocrispum wychmicini]TCO60478.1 SnoaL-like protein [Actinocrispum wychmicini]